MFDHDWIYLVDSGGQPQFSDVFPLLFRSEALYIAVIRLDQDLHQKQDNCYRSSEEEYHLPEKLNLTNWEMIEQICQIAKEQNSETTPKRVMVIATHIDKVTNAEEREERVKDFDKELKKIQDKYEDVLVAKDMNKGRIMYPVNAMSTGVERQTYKNELQQSLINTVKKSIKPIPVPIRWFLHELDLDEKSQKTHGVLKKSECVELGGILGMTTDEVEESLQFFNKLALHLHHPGFPDGMVLVDMDPLIARLSALIKMSFTHLKDVPSAEYNELRKRGIFDKSLLTSAFEKILHKDAISDDDFLLISECLKVIVHVEENKYFIPSVLSVNDTQDPIKHQLIPCIINSNNIILQCYFSTLIVMLLRKKNKKSENCFTLPYTTAVSVPQTRNRIKLKAETYGGILTLTKKARWIGIYYSVNNIEKYIAILEIVRHALEEVVAHLDSLMGTQFSFPAFLCPECSPEDHLCKLICDSNEYECSLDESDVFLVTDDMKSIIKSIKPLLSNSNKTGELVIKEQYRLNTTNTNIIIQILMSNILLKACQLTEVNIHVHVHADLSGFCFFNI